MRARPLVSSVLTASIVLAAVPGRALADEPTAAQKQEAKGHYQEAERAMQEKRFEDAAAAYGAAYEIIKDAFLFYKIGIAHQSAGKCGAAVVYFRRYLKEATVPDDFRKGVEEKIAACEGKPAAGTATETGAATATETGTGTATETGAATDAGAATDTGAAAETDVATEPGAATGTEPSFLDEKPSWQRSTGWILMGTSVALATAGTILALSSQSREEDLEALGDFRNPEGNPATFEGEVRERYEDLTAEGDRFNTWATVAFGAAGVTLVAAATLLVLDARRSDESGSAITLVPVLGRDTAGAAATLRF